MAASLNDFAVAHHNDLIAVADGAESVCHDHAGAAPASDVIHDLLFHNGVQCACGFVHDENAGFCGQGPGDFQTLPLQLDAFNSLFGASFSTNFGDTANRLNERYQFAATLLTIAPLILFYLVMQKQFVKGVESSGITGE